MHLLENIANANIHSSPLTSSLLAQAMSSLILFYTEQLRARGPGFEDTFFDAFIHKFKQPGTSRRYYCIQHRNALPAPFPRHTASRHVYTVTVASPSSKTSLQNSQKYYELQLPKLPDGLERLVIATCDSSVVEHPKDPTNIKTWPTVEHVLLPHLDTKRIGPSFGDVSLRDVRLASLSTEELLGGDQLALSIKNGNSNKRTCILVFHPGGDPLSSPLAWLPWTSALHECSTVAYAFPCVTPSHALDHAHFVQHRVNATFLAGYDIRTFGHHDLDYMISVTLKALPKYELWRLRKGAQDNASPGLNILIHEAGLNCNDALRLHEPLLCAVLESKMKMGAGVYRGAARIVGEALPYGYSAITEAW
ncbi:hypothetical protein C8Q80DRAFT_1304554 [Daedaleopsis nitida]|nr:hypothetical protein C8Q80DRAFT_1304554 [Daedaleopsis nitida]